MNIRYLEIMEAVAETGTFTGAAKKLFITQSAVSHAVAELEAQAGTALFDRFPKGASLTRCGRTLLEESRSILTACRNLDRRISHLEENTPVSIVSSITIASSLLCRTLSRLRTSAPELKTFVRVTTSDNAVDILQRGEADIAFVEGAAPEGNFEIIPLGHYSLRAACAPDFPASRQVIHPSPAVQISSAPQRARQRLGTRYAGSRFGALQSESDSRLGRASIPPLCSGPRKPVWASPFSRKNCCRSPCA